MKKRNTILAVLAIIAILVCTFVMQDGEDTTQKPDTKENASVIAKEGIWKDAAYLENTEFGEGKKTLYVEVSAEGQAVEFTIHTDKKTVGDALKEHKLIEGEEGPYGLYVKKVNSMEADYDKNQTYWAFNKNGEAMLTGIDSAEFSDGDRFELVCTKG